MHPHNKQVIFSCNKKEEERIDLKRTQIPLETTTMTIKFSKISQTNSDGTTTTMILKFKKIWQTNSDATNKFNTNYHTNSDGIPVDDSQTNSDGIPINDSQTNSNGIPTMTVKQTDSMQSLSHKQIQMKQDASNK